MWYPSDLSIRVKNIKNQKDHEKRKIFQSKFAENTQGSASYPMWLPRVKSHENEDRFGQNKFLFLL